MAHALVFFDEILNFPVKIIKFEGKYSPATVVSIGSAGTKNPEFWPKSEFIL